MYSEYYLLVARRRWQHQHFAQHSLSLLLSARHFPEQQPVPEPRLAAVAAGVKATMVGYFGRSTSNFESLGTDLKISCTGPWLPR